MKILVIGAGAVGGYLGACLARSGRWVTVLGRPPVVAAVRERGLQVSLPGGASWAARNVHVISALGEARVDAPRLYAPPYDAVLLCVKAYDIDAVIEDVRAFESAGGLDPDAGPMMVSFQNGVGSEEKLAGAFGADRVIAATLTSPVSVIEPGRVRLDRLGGGIAMAPMAPGDQPASRSLARDRGLGRPEADRFAVLLDALRQTLLTVKRCGDYRSLKWSKMVLNIVANASGAILDWTPRQVYADRRTFGLEMDMLREALSVMRAAGIPPVDLPGAPAATLGRLVRSLPDALLQPLLLRQVAKGRGDKRPSFYYDLPRAGMPGTGLKHRCEVSHLNGEIARRGAALGQPAPVNARLTELLSSLVAGSEDPEAWRGQAGRLTTECRGWPGVDQL